MSTQLTLNGITPYTNQSYATLADIVDKAYVELSFLGTPYVYSQGCTGCVSLQQLAEKVRGLVDFHPNFSPEERAKGKFIQDRVKVLYNISNDQSNRVGFIRGLVFAVIEFWTRRSHILKSAVEKAQLFDHYTQRQFKELYGRDPNDDDKRSSVYPGERESVWYVPDPKRPREKTETNLQAALNGIIPYKKGSSYETFADIVNNAYVEITFWGSRCVRSAGYTGRVELEDLKKKVEALPNAYPEFSAEERKMGKGFQHQVDILIDISLDQVERIRFIRSYIVEFLDCVTKRTMGIYDYCKLSPYDYYTAQQYQDAFREAPNPNTMWKRRRGLDHAKVDVWKGKTELKKSQEFEEARCKKHITQNKG